MNVNRSQSPLNPENLPACIQGFIAYFQEMNLDSVAELTEFYAPDILFTDPIHQVKGLPSLQAYFAQLNKSAIAVSFDFHRINLTETQAYLEWTMDLQLKRPRKTIVVKGISVLTYATQITEQRDYFDLGEMIYEHIPLLGGLLRRIKRKVAASA